MYPGVRFIPRGVGVRALTPEGYEPAWNGIVPAAEYLAAAGRRCHHGDRHLADLLPGAGGA